MESISNPIGSIKIGSIKSKLNKDSFEVASEKPGGRILKTIINELITL